MLMVQISVKKFKQINNKQKNLYKFEKFTQSHVCNRNFISWLRKYMRILIVILPTEYKKHVLLVAD